MNKKIILVGILLAMSLLVANSANALTTVNTDPTSGNPGATVSGSFVLTDNVANNDVTGISFSVVNLVGVTNAAQNIPSSAVSFSPSSVATLPNGQSATITTNVVMIRDRIVITQNPCEKRKTVDVNEYRKC